MSIQVKTFESEYAKDPKIRKEDIQHLKEWLEKQPHMPKVSEFMLTQFYQVCNYSLQSAKNLLDFHYYFKNEAPEIFTGLDYQPPKYHHTFFDSHYFFSVPVRTPENCRIHYLGLQDEDPSKFLMDYVATMLVKITMAIIYTDGSCPNVYMIIDCKGFSFSHLMNTSFPVLRKCMIYIQEAVVVKVNKVYFTNMNSVMEKILQFARTVLSKEFMDKIQIVSDTNEIFKYIPKECIPKDLGGSLDLTRRDLMNDMKSRVKVTEHLIKEELKLKTDESKRQGKERNTSSSQSFKKLSID